MDANDLQPTIIPRPEHNLSRKAISPNALKVLYRLRSAGYRACLTGGAVRDLLMGREPKDFDVTTDAHPEKIRQLFRNCRLIGRRFRLAHIRFGREIIEVATFRGQAGEDHPGIQIDNAGRIVSDNVYGTIEEDALRRDLSVNALYYDINDFSLRDYCHGLKDLEQGLIRLIGDPEQRYREDPVRMLRVIRFAAKLGFRISPNTATPIAKLAPLLKDIPAARLFDEVLKLFLGGHAGHTFEMLRQHQLFGMLFPETEGCLENTSATDPHHRLLTQTFADTDQRLNENKPVTPAFLFAALLWPPMEQKIHRHNLGNQMIPEDLVETVLRPQLRHTAIPKRFSYPMREIWYLQYRLTRIQGRYPIKLVQHPRFRAGYDFLLLRARANPEHADLNKLADWWTDFIAMDPSQRESLITKSTRSTKKKRKRKTADT